MLNVTKQSSNRVDLEISGHIDTEEMREGLDKLIELSEGIGDGKMMYRISNPSLPSIGAMVVEIKRLPKLFGLLEKYAKCAVLTDAGWLRTAANIEGTVFPGIDIKGFEMNHVVEAEEWLQASDQPQND